MERIVVQSHASPVVRDGSESPSQHGDGDRSRLFGGEHCCVKGGVEGFGEGEDGGLGRVAGDGHARGAESGRARLGERRGELGAYRDEVRSEQAEGESRRSGEEGEKAIEERVRDGAYGAEGHGDEPKSVGLLKERDKLRSRDEPKVQAHSCEHSSDRKRDPHSTGEAESDEEDHESVREERRG